MTAAGCSSSATPEASGRGTLTSRRSTRSSGALIWSRTLPADYGAGSFPTVAAGELYLLASGEATQLYALRQSDGSDRWGPKTLPGGDSSTPALDGANVYLSLGGPQTYALDRASGAQRWHYGVCCGGGGTTPKLVGDRLFADSGLIHDIRDGHVLGDYWSGGIPTWSGDLGVAYGNNSLRGFGPTFETTRWTFQIDRYGSYLSAPFIAGPYAYVSTTDLPPWHLMALRLTDGARVWCELTDLPPGSYSSARPHPVAAGDGLLLVNKGYGLAAYASGGQPSACTSLPQSSAAGQPSLELTVSRRSLRLGQRTRLAARLAGMAAASGRTVALDVDPWPFDGRYRRAAVARTGSDGIAVLRYAPRRNVSVRARLVGDLQLVSPPATVYADLPISVRKRDAGGRHARLRVTIRAARRAQILRRRIYGYLARAAKPWRRVADGRWRIGPRSTTVTLRYPPGRLGPGDRWLVCTREREPDAFGRPTRIDRLCGRRTLPR